MLCVVTAAEPTADSPITLDASVSPNPARVAEPIRLRLTLEAPAGTEVDSPVVAESLGEFDVVETQTLEDLPTAEGSGSKRRWITVITLESLRAGPWTVPPLSFECRLNGETEIITSRPIRLTVVSELEPEETVDALRAMKGTLDTADPDQRIVWPLIALAGFAGIVLAVVIGWVWVRRGGPAAAELARRELQLVSTASDSLAAADVHARLSVILRRYLEATFELPAMSLTPPELGDRLRRRSEVPEELAESVRSLLDESDQLRYRGGGSGKDMALPVERYRELIDQFEQARRATEGR